MDRWVGGWMGGYKDLRSSFCGDLINPCFRIVSCRWRHSSAPRLVAPFVLSLLKLLKPHCKHTSRYKNPDLCLSAEHQLIYLVLSSCDGFVFPCGGSGLDSFHNKLFGL